MKNQLPKPELQEEMSHNVYNGSPVGQRNILNSIINSSYSTRLTYSDKTPVSFCDIAKAAFEFICIGIITFGMCYFIAVSDAFDQHLMELAGSSVNGR